MGRRTWIKIFSEKWLRGTIRQEKPEVRGVWIDILALAGDSAYGDDGVIGLAPKCGLTKDQICTILNITPKLWQEAINIFINTKRISVNGANEITILNWKKYQAEYERQKPYRKASPESRINYSIGVAIANSLTKKKNGMTWEKAIGYTRKDLVRHLESLFQKGMNWNNYGKWHIDHIIPKSKFEFKSIDDIEFKECWKLENLQPLWAEDNLSKSNKIGLQDRVTYQGYISRSLGEGEGEGEGEGDINNTITRSDKKLAPSKKKINFNFDEEIWENITDKDKQGWREAYPACNIDIEITRMKEWLISNPEKRKVRYRRFITNWLSRSQDKGGTKYKKQNWKPPYED